MAQNHHFIIEGNMKYVLVRPRINWKKIIISVGIALMVAILAGVICGRIADSLGMREEINKKLVFVCYICMWKIERLEIRVAVAVIILEVIIFSKAIAIWMVRCYQRFAPESIRSECFFEPCCSNYMIMAIEKYGLIKGIYKGIKRIRRCHHPNGGIDYP